MKRYLGLRDTDVVYRQEPLGADAMLFGIDLGERNYTPLQRPAPERRVFGREFNPVPARWARRIGAKGKHERHRNP